MQTTMAYGLAVLAVMALAWASGDHVKQKLGFVLLFAWAASNCAVYSLGFRDAAFLNPVTDGLLAVIAAILGYRNRSVTALMVVALYVVYETVTVLAFVHHTTTTYGFWLAINVIFIAQLVVVGGMSGVATVARIAARPARPSLGRVLA